MLADQLGLEVFGLGEHHRPDYAVSAPAVALAAASTRTERIRLTSAVSVLSSDDPIRVFQQFATLDALSRGRAEIMVGRGSFIESFPLFGHDLDDYDALFDEKLRLLLALNEAERISWPGGAHTPAIDDRGVYPRPFQPALPIWIAVGGTPQSVVRAGTLGLPLALAIIGGEPARFAPLFDLYRRAAAEAGHAPDDAADLDQRPRLRRRDQPGGRRRLLSCPGRGHEPHRPRARLAADQPRPVRGRPLARAARSSPAARRRSPTRSSPTTRSSASTAS